MPYAPQGVKGFDDDDDDDDNTCTAVCLQIMTLPTTKNGYRFFPGGKVRPERDADHSPPTSAAVMEE